MLGCGGWGAGVPQTKFSGTGSRSLYASAQVLGLGFSSWEAYAVPPEVEPHTLDPLETYIFTVYGQATDLTLSIFKQRGL